MPRNEPSARSHASATLRRRRPSVMMIASSAHRIGTHDAHRYRKRTLANGAHGMILPCSGFDSKKSWQGATTTRSTPSPTGSLRNRRARRVALAGGNSQVQRMGRSDPYQEHAREMAREAGLDPEGRIERPGQRSMPVWCTFRDAARKEHLAREAADSANIIAAEKAQAPQFQNSPLKVFGEHDHATVAQMRNC